MGAPGRRRLVPLRRRTRPGTHSPDLTNAFAAEAGPAPLDMIGTLPVTSIAADQPPKVISEMLGHATVAFTMDVYTEVAEELAAAAALAAYVPRAPRMPAAKTL